MKAFYTVQIQVFFYNFTVMDEIPTENITVPAYKMQQSDDSENIDAKTQQPKTRAKSARELVKSQEHLIDLLQNMRSDLAKMDREASSIKEDIVRSNQLFHVMVKMEKNHRLQFLPGGYNISHAQPKVTYARHRDTEKELNIKYLNQLSTYQPRFLPISALSRSNSSDYCDGYRSVTPSSCRFRSRQSSLRRTQSDSSTDDSYSGNSGTESEIDSATSREISRSERSSNISLDSISTCNEAGSSTESLRPQYRNRRSSYFYTAYVDTPPQVQFDEIDL